MCGDAVALVGPRVSATVEEDPEIRVRLPEALGGRDHEVVDEVVLFYGVGDLSGAEDGFADSVFVEDVAAEVSGEGLGESGLA